MNKSNFEPTRNQSMMIGFIIAALIVLFSAKRDEPRYELTIKELGVSSMLAFSDSEALGVGDTAHLDHIPEIQAAQPADLALSAL